MDAQHTPPVVGEAHGEDLLLAWLRGRQTGIGSSDSPVLLLGEVYGRTPMSLYLDKVQPIVAAPEDDDTPDFRRGRTYEPLALALYTQEHPEAVIRRPLTPEERYRDFQVRGVPPWLFADFDGLFLPRAADGSAWVLEVKCPRAWTMRRIRAGGPLPYHHAQSQHLALVAQQVAQTPAGLLGWHGPVAGTRMLCYDCEEVEVLTFDLPHAHAMQHDILTRGEQFWACVQRRAPEALEDLCFSPVDTPMHPPSEKTYVAVEGEAWQHTAQQFAAARRAFAQADAEQEKWKAIVQAGMTQADLTRVLLPNDIKVIYAQQRGRTSFDRVACQAAHPEVPLGDFYKRGQPFYQMRVYAPKED